MAGRNPDMRAAQAAVEQQTHAIESARAALLPTLSFDYFFGINANQFALHDPDHANNLGSVAQAQLTVPLWTWGAARSKIRQAQIGPMAGGRRPPCRVNGVCVRALSGRQ